ncbi:MAG: HTH domain-containing protein [Polyangia bacterium]
MTFVEAALEVLRREGKPLHFKELTRLAVKYDLLSVVGRDPEAMMQVRLQAEVRRPSTDMVRISPGVFGLRSYPPRTGKEGGHRETGKPSADEKTGGETAGKQLDLPAAAPEPARGRRRGRGAGAAAREESGAPAAAEPTAAGRAEAAPAAPAAEAKAEPAGEAARPSGRHRRRGGRGAEAERGPAPSAEAPSPPLAAEPPAAAEAPREPVSPPPAPAAAEAAVTQPASAAVAPPAPEPTPAAVEIRSEPVAAPPETSALPPPAEARPELASEAPPESPAVKHEPVEAKREVTEARPEPSETPRPTPAAEAPRPEGPSRREFTPRPEAPRPAPRPEGTAVPPSASSPTPGGAPRSPAPSATTPSSVLMPAGPPGPPSPPTAPRQMSMADAAYDVLRGSSDGRALTNRQIAEIALKRRLLRGELADLSRALRAALLRETRQRDSDGLRPRVRTVGPGQYMLSERKLESEVYNAERELLDRLNRTREATRVALRRRLRSLPAGAFELLMRVLLERLGMLNAELIKRGEGVAYYAGVQARGARSIKTLVAIRPGEAELAREAVGELRAGLRLRGFDEGLLLCSGRASAAALTEAGAAPGIDLYDQDALTDLLMRHQIGVRRMLLPIDYLDADLFNELLEQS